MTKCGIDALAFLLDYAIADNVPDALLKYLGSVKYLWLMTYKTASYRFFNKMAAMTSSFGRISQNSNAPP